ncbi:type II secretion system inner membrane protein GspF [soil metagenome]
MPLFAYTAVDPQGREIRGTIEATSRGTAFQRIEKDALVPLDVTLDDGRAGAGTGAASGTRRGDRPRLKRVQLIWFTEELADLLEAGLHLQQALGVLASRKGGGTVSEISSTIRYRLREGEAFAASLQEASPSFDDLYVNMVAAGEASGSLARILRRLAENLAILHELQKKFTQALVYPALMVGACIMLTFVFIAVLVPQLSDLLSKSGQDLPLITRALVAVGHFSARWGWAFIVGLAAGFGIFRAAVATGAGRQWWDRAKVRLPLVGAIIESRFLAGFCQALGNLVTNGVPLLPALRLVVRATSNRHYRSCLAQVAEDVAGGDSLSGALHRTGAFPSLLEDIVAVGEQTGNLGRSLTKATSRYDKELDARLKRLTSLISPVIIIFLSVVVTVVAYSIVTSIFSAVSGIRSQT